MARNKRRNRRRRDDDDDKTITAWNRPARSVRHLVGKWQRLVMIIMIETLSDRRRREGVNLVQLGQGLRVETEMRM